MGAKIIRNALDIPLRLIAENAGTVVWAQTISGNPNGIYRYTTGTGIAGVQAELFRPDS